ncbi:twin-arginine translocation signal domain-containing protein [Halobacteria archaeon AArc-m2/3/4]|uniref:Twin-arginine translocation signal domain-containing protein n=1 Tax=Natronoglomus mannanivorans TaxID=2979990 RepID=A0ABT2QF90_9EURY|nr:twin-arginine translocation signal domain-containing protein [Halobacteria archaeon AArc-m2/3/4]
MNGSNRESEQSTETKTTDKSDRTVPLSRRGFLRTSAATGVSALALGASGLAAGQDAEACELWDEIEVGGGDFILFNNKWGMEDSEQCIWRNDDGSYGYDFTAVGSGINYPQVFLGTRPWGEDTGVPEFPIERGDVDELVMEFDVDVNISGGEWNLAEEWWLMDGQPDPENAPDTHEIMLVLDSENHSHGGVIEHDVFTDQFGNSIDYWARPGGGTDADFHVFRLAEPSTTGRVDLKPILEFMTDRQGVSEDLLLSGIELGNEYWAGTQGDVTYNQFDVTINGTTYTSGSDAGSGGPTTPTAPANQWTNEVTETSIEIGWDSVAEADAYRIYLDGTLEEETSSTTATITGLSPDTSYEIGIAAVANGDASDVVTTTVNTDAGDDPDGPPSIDGTQPADTTGDGLHNDFTGSGQTTTTDVNVFFENVDNPDVADYPQYYDFDGNGQVSVTDVVELFESI